MITSGDHHDDVSTHKGSLPMSTTHISVSSNRSTTQEAAQRPQWLDEPLYPFQSRFVEVEGNRIHYIDEGTGPTLFFVHSGVGWSLLYSDIIQDLRGRFRCVALDLPGFGLSPAAPGYHSLAQGVSDHHSHATVHGSSPARAQEAGGLRGSLVPASDPHHRA